MSGVRMALPAIRVRAAKTSSTVGGSMRCNTGPAQLDASAHTCLECLAIHIRRGREILDGQAERLEERDFFFASARWRSPDQHLSNLTDDVIRPDLARLERREEIAWFLERGFPAIHVQPRSSHSRRVE